jgi:hypothetical protein
MAQTYKILGQVAPSGASNTDLYTVPASTQAIVSTLSVCNTGTVSTSYRVAVRPTGESIASKHYIAYDAVAEPYNSTFLTLGLSLGSSDVVTVYAGSGILSFGLFGIEIT